MSVEVDVFSSESVLDDALFMLEDEFGLTLTKRSDGTWQTSVFGITVTLVSAHDLVDDCGIAFSRYPLQVNFVRYAGEVPDLRAQLCEVLARLIAKRLNQRTRRKTLVVAEMQKLMAEYPDDSEEALLDVPPGCAPSLGKSRKSDPG